MLAEAFAPTIGLSSPPDGCGYSASRQMIGTLKVLEKTGSVAETARAAATDLVTLESEFFKLRTIIPYTFRVLENGVWENGGRTLEEINDPKLTDGERIKGVIEVQNAMAQNPRLIQGAVGSEDFGSGRNYLYLFTKDLNDKSKINALAIEHQGNKDEFKSFLKALSPSANNSSVSFARPLFFDAHNKLLIGDVFRAVLDSYKEETRREEMRPYLTRFARDTADFPKLLTKHQEDVDTLTKKFQDEMLANGDVVSGLSLMVSGINKTVESWITRDREIYQERLGMNRERVPKGMEGKKAVESVFEPLVPAIIGIIKDLTLKDEDKPERLERKTMKDLQKETRENSKKDKAEKNEEEKVWRTIIKARLPAQRHLKDDQLVPSSSTEFISSEIEGCRVDFVAGDSFQVEESADPPAIFRGDEEEKERIKDGLQLVLEILLADDDNGHEMTKIHYQTLYSSSERTTVSESRSSRQDGYRTVTRQARTIGFVTDSIKLIESARVIVKEEDNAYFPLLLEVYDRLGQKEEIREFILALIYCHLIQRVSDVSLDLSSEEIDVLTSKMDFLRKRLRQIFKLPLDKSSEIDREPLFILYSLTLAMLDSPHTVLVRGLPYDRAWLIERLNNLKQNPFGKKLSKKKKRELPLYATIFFYQIVFQYQDTCYQSIKMTK